MLGIFLLICIGKKFAELTDEYEKNKLVFVLLGIATYYIGTFIFGFVFVLTCDLFNIVPIEHINEFLLGWIAAPVGILACTILYQLLKRIWEKQRVELTQSTEQKIKQIGMNPY